MLPSSFYLIFALIFANIRMRIALAMLLSLTLSSYVTSFRALFRQALYCKRDCYILERVRVHSINFEIKYRSVSSIAHVEACMCFVLFTSVNHGGQPDESRRHTSRRNKVPQHTAAALMRGATEIQREQTTRITIESAATCHTHQLSPKRVCGGLRGSVGWWVGRRMV